MRDRISALVLVGLMARSPRLWSSKYFVDCVASCKSRMITLISIYKDMLTLTSLSHPLLTITGFCGLGLNRTQETQSVCPFSVMVNLQSPRVFHSLMVRSRDPETICLLSAEKETERTSLVWPTNRRVVVPVESSQRRRVLSQDAERA